LVAAVKDVGALVGPFGADGGVAGGGPQIDVLEAGGDFVNGDAGFEAVDGRVGPERVQVCDRSGTPAAAQLRRRSRCTATAERGRGGSWA